MKDSPEKGSTLRQRMLEDMRLRKLAPKNGNSIEADRLLRFLAHVDAVSITQCSDSPKCRELMMTSAPDQALVQEALTWN